MEQYIPKSVLVAEIERMLRNVNLNYVNAGSHPSSLDTNKKLQEGISKNIQSILSFINTIEVKEVGVDLGDPKGDKSEKYIIDTLQEEPVSEELEKCIDHYEKLIGGFENMSNHDCRNVARYFADWGAQWQKQQDQEIIELAEDHAMLAGMEKMREEMMKDAVDGYVIEDIEEGNGDFLLSADYLPSSMGLKGQQKVKVIVIKED